MTDLSFILPEPISALAGVLTAALILSAALAAVLFPFLFYKNHMLRAHVPWLAMAVLVFAAAAVTGIQSSAAQCMMGSTDRPHPVSTCDELITAITRPKGTDCDTPGSIYTAILKLEENFTGTCDIIIADDVYAAIDLNGQTLKGTGSGSVITVNGTLTLMDSREGGTITGGNAEKGGGVFVEGESFTMKGGNISGNNASMTGGGVEVSFGSFTMSGGNISGNTASQNGGGVYVDTAGNFEVHSIPKVTGNTGGNVFLENGTTINVIDQLSDEARLGITMESPGVFTSGLSDKGDKSNFSSDDETYDVGVNADGEAILIPKNKYTVTFLNYDDTELQSSSEVEGTMPEYKGETPIKPADAQYTYTFAGWSPSITEVTKDQTYTATYSSSIRNYSITFVNEDGKSVLKDAVQYPYGTAAADIVKPADPARSADAKYSYTFSSWSPAITEVTRDQTYKATYSRTVNEYTICFWNDNGDVLQTSQVKFGEKPVYRGKTPEKTAWEGHTYAFAGWDKEIVACTGPENYTATYIVDSEVFTIRFLNEGVVLQSNQMAYLAMPQYTGETPVRAASEEYTYRFEGWTPEIKPVIMDADYKAVFSSWKYMLEADYRDPEGTAISAEENYQRGSNRDKVYRFVLTQPQNSDTNLLNKFKGLRMDGDPNYVDPSNYEASEGSLIIRLKAGYLEGLSAGNHTLTVVFDDGEVNAPCNVVENENTFPIPVEFVFIQYDGSYGVPFDTGTGTLNPVIIIKDGEAEISRSAAVELAIPPAAPEKPDRRIAEFSEEVEDLAPGKYAVSVSGLPKEIAREIPDGDAADKPKIRLTAKAEINIKSGKPVITVYLIFDGRIQSKYEEAVVYALPEDEIGAYWLRKDGTKEYLLFHTYDICMTYLGKAELCEGPERCFHKDGK